MGKPKWRVRPNALTTRMAQQDEVLRAASAYVRPGGRLVYATCSFLMEEDEDRVADFLTGHPGFAADSTADHLCASGALTEAGCDMVRRLETPTGALRLTPHSANTDGFFVAVLRKTG